MSETDAAALSGYGMLFTGAVTLLAALCVRFVVDWPLPRRKTLSRVLVALGVASVVAGLVMMARVL